MEETLTINRLRQLHLEAAEIRKKLGVSEPGSVVYQAELEWNSDSVVVEADGFGGATAMVVAGNYPLDYFPKFQRFYSKEQEAVNEADSIASGKSF